MKPNSAPHIVQFSDDLEEFELDYLNNAPEKDPRRARYARIGGAALAVALVASSFAAKTKLVEAANRKNAEPVATVGDIYTAPNVFQSVVETPVITINDPVTATATIPTITITPDAAPAVPVVSLEQPVPVELEQPATPEAPVWNGPVLNAENGHIDGPTGDETYYNLPMDHIVERMRTLGNTDEYWVREDGAKMLGPYVMVAANLKTHPRGSIVETSLGPGIVCDTGSFAKDHPNRLDIATNW